MRRSKHSLSHYRIQTLDQGQLFPVACMEVLPGDSFRHQTAVLLRVSPLVAPVMHPVHIQVHHWYVPNRLLWANWETFITTNNNTNLLTPTVDVCAAPQCKELAQAFGIGVDTASSLIVNALPFRAYNKIWNEFYRDQDLQPPLVVPVTDGPDVASTYALQNVDWQKDYFTIARPYPQQGSASSVALLTGEAPVRTKPAPIISGAVSPVIMGNTANAGVPLGATGLALNANGQLVQATNPGGAGTGAVPNNLVADLSGSAVSMDINEWRRSMAYQRITEHRNRYGHRYTDYLRYLGITPSDARLQRPEYLGGGRQTISFSEVLSTAETTGKKIGDFGGHGIAAMRTRPYKRFFEEHGWVISLISVRPITVYQNQVPKKFLRRAWSDYWQKELEIMGEQAVQNVEVYADSATPTGVFGYVPRHDEYRRHESYVGGEFRSTLNYWHMARNFASQPALNASFVKCDPTNRIYASTTTDQLYTMIAHNISARRLVSKVARTM